MMCIYYCWSFNYINIYFFSLLFSTVTYYTVNLIPTRFQVCSCPSTVPLSQIQLSDPCQKYCQNPPRRSNASLLKVMSALQCFYFLDQSSILLSSVFGFFPAVMKNHIKLVSDFLYSSYEQVNVEAQKNISYQKNTLFLNILMRRFANAILH